MALYNVSKIENLYDDFSSCKNKYTNTYYADYIGSYIKECSDNTINKMERNLNKHYNRIKKIYNNINKFWNEYLNDLKNTDNRLAGAKGSINAPAVSAKLSKLPALKEYKADLKVKFSNASAVVGTPKHTQWLKDNITLETGAVIGTSIISGVEKLREHIADGLIWCGGMIASGSAWIFDKEASKRIQKATMDVIAYDVVGQVNKKFYEETYIGKRINEYSSLKYDSTVAKTIQNGTTKVAEIAAATAITIASAGTATPVAAAMLLGTGFVEGAGKKAEEAFQKEDRDFFGDAGEISVAGTIKAIEFYSEGQMGAGLINAGSLIKNSGGIKSIFKQVLSKDSGKIFTKDLLRQGVKKTLTDADTYLDSVGAAVNNVTYDRKNGLKINWNGLAKETACNFALNFVSGYVGNVFEGRLKNDAIGSNTNVNEKVAIDTNPKLTLEDLKYNKNSILTDGANYLDSNIKKYVYKNTNYFDGLNDEIKANGLYHFTNAADEILSSGYIKSSDVITSYGNRKTFFFNGVPSVGQVATNIDNISLRTVAVKVNPTDELLNSGKLKVRSLNDGAITYDGKFGLSDVDASKEYFCLFKENNELVYKKVSKEFYDNYPNSVEGNIISDFLSNKKNVKAIKSDYLNEMANQKNAFSSLKSGPTISSSDSNFASLKREYDELLTWKNSDKFKTDEAYWQAYGDRIGGNPYKKNMDRINELEKILSNK